MMRCSLGYKGKSLMVIRRVVDIGAYQERVIISNETTESLKEGDLT